MSASVDATLGAGAAVAVEYDSHGALLIAGPVDAVLACAERLRGVLRCTLLVDGENATAAVPGTLSPWSGTLVNVDGHLGAFRVRASLHGESDTSDLGARLANQRNTFDLVLDLGAKPCIQRSVLPLGYFAPADAAALEHALGELPGLVGEFEKPKYFRYDAALCAHGDSGQVGCTRCLEACAASAIVSAGDRVRIDPYLCQGCGACATVCPTGAVSYDYPDRATLIDELRRRVQAARDEDSRPSVVFHDCPELAPVEARGVLPVVVEDVASVGMEAWLSALAFGACRVLIVHGPDLPAESRRVLDQQLDYAHAILEALDLPAVCLVRVAAPAPSAIAQALAASAPDVRLEPAAFAGLGDKRKQLRFAVDHLYAASGRPLAQTPLPAGAPFGAIDVAGDACTLCMSCVGVCPAHALEAGGDRPALNFLEINCVQCGLCQSACPEDAITLRPRLLFDAQAARTPRTLHEEQAFACIACGKPFATAKMIETILERLGDHWMFRDERARSRLKMCEDCRVHDAAADGGRQQ